MLRVAVEPTLESSLHPTRWKSLSDVLVGRQIYETLVTYDASLRIAPGLADAWDVSRDGMRWTFRLCPRTFHDGVLANAARVSECLSRWAIPRLQTAGAHVEVSAKGNDLVRMRLQQPFAPFLDHLTNSAAIVAPIRDATRLDVMPPGTGPYVLDRLDSDGVVRLKLRHDADCQSEAPEQLTFVPLLGGGEMWTALLDGSIDVAYEVPYHVIAYDRVPPDVHVRTRWSLSVSYLLFNTTKEPLDRPDVRRAIAEAIDKDELLEVAHLGVGQVARGPIAPCSPFYTSLVPKETNAPTICNATLDILATEGYSHSWLALFVQQLARAGVTARVHTCPFSELYEAVQHLRFSCVLMGRAGRVDPDAMFSTFHSRSLGNYGAYSNPIYDRLVERARGTFDFDERRMLYAKAGALLANDVPAVFLRHGLSIVAHARHVAGIDPNPTNLLDLSRAHIGSDPIGDGAVPCSSA